MSTSSDTPVPAVLVPKPQHPYNVRIERVAPEALDYLAIRPSNMASNPSTLITVDLRSKFPPCYDQGDLGSCTANALCGLMQYDDPLLQGSRLFVYYNERVLEHDVSQDDGATLADGVTTLRRYGVCEESLWPYVTSNFATKPTTACYTAALAHTALQVKNIPNTLLAMRTALLNGYPFVFGISVYQSFESDAVAATGMVPMPGGRHDPLLGGHALVCVGFNDTTQRFIVRNSWGTSWGDHGYCYIPYAYLTNSNYTSDLWNIMSIKNPTTA